MRCIIGLWVSTPRATSQVRNPQNLQQLPDVVSTPTGNRYYGYLMSIPLSFRRCCHNYLAGGGRLLLPIESKMDVNAHSQHLVSRLFGTHFLHFVSLSSNKIYLLRKVCNE